MLEVLHAEFHEHAYPPHTHQAWTVLIVDQGAISYDLHGRRHGSTRADVTVLPPHVTHDGRPATGAGFRKRVLYLDTTVLPEALIGAAVDRPTITDPGLRRALHHLHLRLRSGGDPLDAETRLAMLGERLTGRLLRGGSPGGGPAAPNEQRPAEQQRLAAGLRDLLDSHLHEQVRLADAGRVLGAGPARLVRAFSATFGITPHAYVLGRRLEAARSLLLDGRPPAEAAARAGFYDQAHLTRHFRRYLATTPARFGATGRAGNLRHSRTITV